ncbi:TPA: hydrogenase maturation nickel metallochaperone HypA [Klebsiella oxytoca]|uniref:Hydrogenase maturation nickel metallochaperone HypA n=1 Tax=Klebsiella oxytoca TaxID=571 RepID=A0AAN5RGR4_KLEOX|nr:hydrogenase maturation nickel metallochaperone HypA [Klebsiella oxytoca]
MLKSYSGIADPVDYARFCDLHSFDPDSPYIRQYYKKSLAQQALHERLLAARRAASHTRTKPLPVVAIGLTAAIELAVKHLHDEPDNARSGRWRCLACHYDFSGPRVCPKCGNHVFLTELNK